MKYLWKRATGLLLTSALVLGLAACGGTPTGNTNPPEDPGTQQTTQPVAPDSGAAGEKLVYSNGLWAPDCGRRKPQSHPQPPRRAGYL